MSLCARKAGSEEILRPIRAFLRNEISVQVAAEQLGTATLNDVVEDEEWPMHSLHRTWSAILYIVRKEARSLDKFVQLLLAMVNLPPVLDEDGHPLLVRNTLRVWADLPGLTHEFYNDAKGERFAFGDQRIRIAAWVHMNKFMGKLLRTRHPVFHDLKQQGIITMGNALEIDWNDTTSRSLFIPAATAFISAAGRELYQWEFEKFSESRPLMFGANTSGHLYDGKLGYNKERWEFWKKRFEEFSVDEEMSEYLREVAAEGVAWMKLSERERLGRRHVS